MDSHNTSSQDQGMYFTNLLSEDSQLGSLDDDLTRQSGTPLVNFDDSVPLPRNKPTVVKKSVRGANFSLAEDKLLVASWLNTSIDAVVSTDQRITHLWERIFSHFQEYKETTTERTVKSLSLRWSLIQKATNKFCAKVAQIEVLDPSGMTEKDKLEKARIMYNKLEGHNFQFEHCWNQLKDQPKWISQGNYVPKGPTRAFVPIDASFVNLETGNTNEKEVIELDRPIGKKAEKEKRKSKGNQVEENNKFRKIKYTLLEESRTQEKEFYRLKAEKMEYEKEKEDERLRLDTRKVEYEKEREDNRLRQEDERLRLKAEKIKNEKEKEEKRLRQEDERLRLEAEKMKYDKEREEKSIMMMDVSVMPEMERLYFEELKREVMRRRNLT